MFEKLLIVTDMSPSLDAIIECVGNLKNFGAKECTLLQCMNTQQISSLAFSYSTSIIDHILEEKKEKLQALGFKVQTRIISGFPKKVVNKIAVKEDYSMIIVGEVEHSRTGEFFFDKLSYDVIHTSEIPVLIVRLVLDKTKNIQEVKAVGCQLNDHILFPTDFSENADYAFDYLRKMVSNGVKKVTLMHVQNETRISPHLNDQIEKFNKIDHERLERLKNDLSENSDVEIKLVIKYGNPTQEILKVIKEMDISLVVMGSQGRGFLKDLFIGSVSHNITRHSNTSVLLVPLRKK